MNRRQEEDEANADDVTAPIDATAAAPAEATDAAAADATATAESTKTPRNPGNKLIIEEEEGEPPADAEEEAATTADPWQEEHRPPWQRHSELGPNLNPQGLAQNETAPWDANAHPPDFALNGPMSTSPNCGDSWTTASSLTSSTTALT